MPEPMNELEKALVTMSPAPARLDRDALMYSAGRAAAPRRRLSPALACGFAAISGLKPCGDAGTQIIENRPFGMAPFKPAEVRPPSRLRTGNLKFRLADSKSYRARATTLRHGDLPCRIAIGGPWVIGRPSIEKELDLPLERLRGVNQPSSPF